MAKSIVKEIIIILLLVLAIIIVLGLLLYEYVPMAKVIPEPVSYKAPENVQEEISDKDEVDGSEVIMTYEVNSSELNDYQKVKKYNPGKANPFSSYQAEATGTTNGSSGSSTGTSNGLSQTTGSTTGQASSSGSTTGGTSSGDSGSSGGSNESNSSGGTYFQNKGTK